MEKVEQIKKENECCPVFQPEIWDGKIFKWNNKKFIKTSIPTLFHIPLPPMIGNKVTKMMNLAEKAKSLDKNKKNILLLFKDPSAFKTEMFLSVTGSVPDIENTTLSGTFISQVFDASYRVAPKLMDQIKSELAKEGKEVKDLYVHYSYCPKCARDSGHNYMVFFAQLD